MPEDECPRCGEPFSRGQSLRVLILRGENGYLIIGGREHPLHRCQSLDAQEEAQLWSEAGTYLDQLGQLDTEE